MFNPNNKFSIDNLPERPDFIHHFGISLIKNELSIMTFLNPMCVTSEGLVLTNGQTGVFYALCFSKKTQSVEGERIGYFYI